MITISDKDYPKLPVITPEPIKLKGQVIYLKDYRIARRIKAVRLAAVGGKA